ncbi:MAG: TonB-dependent receptor, partial [Bacteroidetes bacterium]|nr:TonB-dependent receptor [Bacteroidota bacterium]
DANIKWEETTTYNVGVDFGFLDSRITGSIDVYQRETRDLLNFIPVPAGTNLTNAITTNVGDLKNRGIEITLNTTPIKTDKMSWEIGGNITINRNEITKLLATEDSTYQGVATGGISGGVGNMIQIHSVGFPANSFFVYEQVYDDNGVPIEGLYVDRNGDGMISLDDRYRYENPAADVFFGFTTLFNYGNFNASLAGRAMYGNAMYNNVLSNQAVYNNLYNSAGYIANVHAATSDIDFTVPQYFSDHFIQDASFLKIDNVTVGYSFPKLISGGNLNVSLTVQNPVMFTNYTGIDPEQFNGIDVNIYPRPRTYLLGVNANF